MVCAGHKEIRTNRASSLDPLRPCSRHLIRPHNDISSGYQVLSDFVMRGLVRTILTTNFDSSLSDALKARQTHIRDGSRSQPPPGNYDQFNVFNKCQLVWLQDALSNIPDKNAAGEVGAPDTNLASLLKASARRRADYSHRLSRSRGRHLCTEQGRVARFSSRHTYKSAFVMAKRCALMPSRSHGGSAQISAY